jgi:hypothetical protein
MTEEIEPDRRVMVSFRRRDDQPMVSPPLAPVIGHREVQLERPRAVEVVGDRGSGFSGQAGQPGALPAPVGSEETLEMDLVLPLRRRVEPLQHRAAEVRVPERLGQALREAFVAAALRIRRRRAGGRWSGPPRLRRAAGRVGAGTATGDGEHREHEPLSSTHGSSSLVM